MGKKDATPSMPRGPSGRRLTLGPVVKAALGRKNRARSAMQTRQTYRVRDLLARLGM